MMFSSMLYLVGKEFIVLFSSYFKEIKLEGGQFGYVRLPYIDDLSIVCNYYSSVAINFNGDLMEQLMPYFSV